MEPHDRLDHLLQDLEDGCELVFRSRAPDGLPSDPLRAAWQQAAAGAADALATWRSTRTALAHATYLAAADQADSAQDALARRALAAAAGV
jgi:hypothetical protein